MEELIRYLINCKNYKLKYIIKSYLTQEVQNILDKYNLTLYELCYRIQHNISLDKIFTCKYCGKKVKLTSHGYRSYCGRKCLAIDNNSSEEVKVKRKQTCLKKYGVDSYSKTVEYKDYIKTHQQDIQNKMRKTCLKKYGVDNYSRTRECLDKMKQTCLERFGEITNLKTKDTKNKIKQTCLKRYGVDNPIKVKQVQDKIKQTCLEKYGVEHYSKTEKYKEKVYNTKKKNGTFVTSKPEEKVYQLLLTKFTKDDIIRQYRSKLYPFNCDFYIKSLDLYIEYNGSWTHGWNGNICLGSFNKDNLEHIKLLEFYKNKNTDYYKAFIYTWTDLDVRKLETFKRNNLNYKIFWNLEEVKDWINKIN